MDDEKTKIGYARVSTSDQTFALQEDALRKAGCERIFYDKASGAKTARPGLDQAIQYLRKGDVLVVWKLDRLGRSLRHLIDVVAELSSREIGFQSLTEALDTTTPGGRLIFHIMGALAQFERDIIRERTQAGLAAGRARGRLGGRPKLMVGSEKYNKFKSLITTRDPETNKLVYSVDDIRGFMNKISRNTYYRWRRFLLEQEPDLKGKI